MLAEEVLLACDENNAEASPHGSTSELGLANPAVHFFRGLRHRNLNAIRHATQRGIHQLQQLQSHNNSDNIFLMKNRSSPLTIQGLRTNPKGLCFPSAYIFGKIDDFSFAQTLKVTSCSLTLKD